MFYVVLVNETAYNCVMFDYIVVMINKLLKRHWGIEIIIDREREKTCTAIV
jgi:hypothetical protein